jgi:hypothetical protein
VSHKSDVAGVVKRIFTLLENQTGHRVKAVRTDRGGEYLNQSLADYFAGKGATHQTTTPYTPEQNGKAERLNRTIVERVRAMLLESGLKEELWAEAAVVANYLRNRSPATGATRTPWELFYGTRPSVRELRVFGSRAYVLKPKPQRHGKLDAVSQRGTFVGYAANSKAYRVLLDGTNKIVESRDVVFNERTPIGTEPAPAPVLVPDIVLDSEAADSRVNPPRAPSPVAASDGEDLESEAASDHASLQRAASTASEEGAMRGAPRPRAREAENVVNARGSRYPRREHRSPGQWYVANAASTDNDAPANEREALARPDADMWRRAMDDELASLMANETW